MTPTAVTVRPPTAFKESAWLVREEDATAVPVVDGTGRPVGVVSEADLLRRGFPSGASTAQHLETSPAVTARPG